MRTQGHERAASGAVAAAVLASAGVAAGRAAGGVALDVPWAPTWGLRLAFELDDLAVLYGALAAGIGVLVFLYASAYVPRHLDHQERPRSEATRLHGAMVLFLVAMLGLVTAQDLVALFVFWDLTAVASWLLIGFDRQDRDARLSALMALLVTGVSAVGLLVGILVLRAEYGTTNLPELVEVARPGGAVTLAGALIAVAALAKSAQVPFHFWLPRAMAAPTPVSAYLHSAAMVAAGVFLLSRVHPLLALSPELLDGLLVVGLTSVAVGGVLALAADGLKRLLAYSTISQYGYVTAMLGIGGQAGLAGASFYVLAHALAKSALFMTAGTVSEATGERGLSALGGLGRRMPLLAAGSGAAAATIAALPATLGFFKDELYFKAALERGSAIAVLAVVGAALTFAYMARFWCGLFLGPERGEVTPVERRLVWPVAALGALVVLGGLVVTPYADLARDAAAVAADGPVALEAAYHLDARAENLMALAAYLGGAALFAGGALLRAPLDLLERVTDRVGPERAYGAGLRGLSRASDRLHTLEVRDLRARIAAVIVPATLLVVLGVAVTPTAGAYVVGEIPAADTPLVVALGVCALGALGVTAVRGHVALVLALSGVGFALATTYSIIGAPDVALVAVLIETLFALLFLGVFTLLPRDVLRDAVRRRATGSKRVRDVVIAVGSGVVTTLVVWGAFSRPLPADGSAERQLEAVEAAHGKDVVTVILADFRGLDTLVEITVVAVAMVAVVAILRARTGR